MLRPSPWRVWKRSPLADIGIHVLDYAHHLLGEPKVLSVSATIHAELGQPTIFTDKDGQNADYIPEAQPGLGLGAIRDGQAPSPSFEEGLQVQRVLAAIEESAAEKSIVVQI